MKDSDQYHKRIEWSEEDQTYIGQCPDLITGIQEALVIPLRGGFHGDDPVKLYGELCQVVEEVIEYFKNEGRRLPPAQIHPMRNAA